MQQTEKFAAEFVKFMEEYMNKRLSLRRIPINVFNTLSTLVIASLGLISALAWDHFLHDLFTHLLNGEETLSTVLAYAIVVTGITVIVTLVLGKKSREK